MLSLRSAVILRSIIEHYIERAAPVPSQSLMHSRGLDVSSATIRNEMVRLEQEGYIVRPHTSAGSVPSDKGYRFYVETLGDIRLPVNQQRMVAHLFHQVETRLEEWVRLTATVLAHLTQSMAFVATARSTQAVFKHMEMVSIQERTALLVLVFPGARVRQQLIALPQAATQEDLSAISNRLNAAFAGLSAERIEALSLGSTDVEKQVVGTVLNMIKSEDAVSFEEPYLEGLQFLFSQPEFTQPGKSQALIDLLEQKSLVREILPRGTAGPGVRVLIGQENASESVQKLSIIIAQYGLPGEAVGCIAVVGPTRMPYSTGIASVDFLSEVLTRLIARLYGKDIPPESLRSVN